MNKKGYNVNINKKRYEKELGEYCEILRKGIAELDEEIGRENENDEEFDPMCNFKIMLKRIKKDEINFLKLRKQEIEEIINKIIKTEAERSGVVKEVRKKMVGIYKESCFFDKKMEVIKEMTNYKWKKDEFKNSKEYEIWEKHFGEENEDVLKIEDEELEGCN